ncbi:hypothetical protein N7462_002162 [Penicillium macrosclerotiorum]|uniref:uncharacterized protein n=1 Tax=Penicillium macrosclerotiorum TaxID=303699 RepID=UPI002549868D|nr:uncharacterized protein N7462_002162 [Penicillium macrosclerotiorum]KAJ5692739.1 hypothetical protein N7462_002162 [Penicillium macrosclerotiorum]
MRITNILLFFAATAWGADIGRRDDTTTASESGFNLAQISSALANLKPNTTASANFGNISPPPKSLISEILSVVPLTVLWELINQDSRSSLASQFSAGTTPAWYSSLPADVKSYMSVVKSQISGGALTATTGLAYETTSTSTGTGTGTGAGASATGSTKTVSGSTSTSSGLGVSQPTVLTASVVGALGVLGLALVL